MRRLSMDPAVAAILVPMVFAGCKSAEEAPTDSDDPVPTEEALAPFIDPWEPVEVDFERDQVEASLQEAIDVVIDLHAGPALEAYAAVMTESSAQCPDLLYDFDGYSAWVDSCSTMGGAQFSGYAYVDSGAEGNITYETLALSATISSDVQAFSGAGYWGESHLDEPPIRFWGSFLEGQVLWDGATGDTWITRGIRPSIEIERSRYGDVPFTFVNLRGALGGLDAPMSTVEFTDIVMEDPLCAEPTGIMSARDPDGNWFDLVFDGETCDGCGTVSHLGETVGEACVDLTPWTSWLPPEGL